MIAQDHSQFVIPTTTDFVVIATVAGDEEWSGRHRCRDASGEVFYFATIDLAIEYAIELTDACRSPDVSYTVEAA